MTATASRPQPMTEDGVANGLPPDVPPKSLARGPLDWRPQTQSAAGLLLIALVLGLGYSAGALFTFWYLEDPASGAVFFPAAGLSLAVLLLTPRRTWPLWLSVVALCELTVDVSQGQPLAMGLGFAVANVVEPFLGATAVMWAMARRRPGLRGSLAIYLLLAVALAPVVGGVIGGTISSLSGVDSPWWIITSKWWLGDALGVLVVGTALLAWSRLSPYEARAPWLETVAMVVVAVSVTLLPAILFDHPTLYAALPILLWAALRGGSRSVSLAAAGIAFAANWATVTGRVGNLVHGGHATDQLVFVQVFLGVTITSALIVAVEVAARVQAESHARAADVERDIALRAAEGATDEERRRIAREIHDIVGHALNVVLLQAGAARRVLTTDPALTTHLLESIEDVGRDAFRNLDIALRLMEDGGPLTPSNNLAGIPRLVETMAQAGISVELDMEDHAHLAIPIATEWAAFRLVQESLTNVAKHAPNAHVLVSISFESDRLCLSIIDDGTGSQPTRGAGRGLQGMHQRAEILGGHVEFGTAPEGGFAVRAELPGDALADA